MFCRFRVKSREKGAASYFFSTEVAKEKENFPQVEHKIWLNIIFFSLFVSICLLNFLSILSDEWDEKTLERPMCFLEKFVLTSPNLKRCENKKKSNPNGFFAWNVWTGVSQFVENHFQNVLFFICHVTSPGLFVLSLSTWVTLMKRC